MLNNLNKLECRVFTDAICILERIIEYGPEETVDDAFQAKKELEEILNEIGLK